MGAGEHTRVSGIGPPVATRFSGNRGVLSVPYRRLFAGRLEAIREPTSIKNTRPPPPTTLPARRKTRAPGPAPARPAAAPRPAGATDTCWRTTEVPNAAPWDTNARGPRSAIASYIPKDPNLCSNDKSTYPGRKTGAPPLYFLPEPARPIIAIARMRRKGRWRTPAPGFFSLFALRELVSPTILARSSQHLGGMVGEW